MAELRPIPFPQLLHRLVEEPARQGTLFDLPLRKAWRPGGADLSVDVHGHRAQTPVGPAAGPHAQLAQNIVLSWLGGARVIELKTVQILDELTIPRPCIDAATIGFNVEWSQELRLEESLPEYVAGWMLLRMLRELDPIGLGAEAARAADPVFELSIGYDLKGIQSPRMRDYLNRVKDVAPIIEGLRAQIPARHRALRDLDYRRDMVGCVTLSTFHGCPAEEVESIARHLIEAHDVDVIVKLNPTLLGYDEVCYLLHDRMGYHELAPKRAAFDGDLRWDQAIALGRRLSDEAARRGRRFGVKMTNTLVVENHKRFFKDKEMYLSGAPLHVLAMHCVDRWRAAMGAAMPISFSGGIDQHNFADAVACDLVPVTTCTDLLRPGGYGRLPRYLANLEEAMADCGAGDRAEFLLRRFDQAAEAVRVVLAELREDGRDEPELEAELLAAAKSRATPLARVIADFEKRRGCSFPGLHERLTGTAGILNTHKYTASVTGDPRYAAGKNSKPPRKVGSQLVLLDCLSCDKCVPVCPNDANFVLQTGLEEIAYEDLILDEKRAITRAPGGVWKVTKPEQWANYADACNECGNCDVFCPEDGGPYVVKARFFGSLQSFHQSQLDGIYLENAETVHARMANRRYQIQFGPQVARLSDGRITVEYDVATAAIRAARAEGDGPHRLSGAVFLTVRALVRGALAGRLNPVSAMLHA